MAVLESLLGRFFPKQKSFDPMDVGSTFKPLGGGKNSTIYEFAKNMPSIAYPAINAISSDFATIQLKLFKDDQEIESHPALTSLKYPYKQFSDYKLLKQTAMYLLVTGECFWYISDPILGRYRNIRVLNQLLLAEIKYDEAGEPTAYVFQNNKRGQPTVTFDAKNILFYHNENLSDLTRGFSPYTPIREYIDASEGAIEYNNRFFQNDATPSGIIKLKQNNSSPMQRQQIKAEWSRSFRGANNSHKVGVMDGDMEFTPIGVSMKDMAFKELMDIAERRILSQYALSKTIIGQTEDVNRATIEGAEYNYSKRVLKPLFDDFTAFLDTMYLPVFEQIGNIMLSNWYFTYESPVTEDMLTKAQIAQIGVGTGFMDKNEAREMIGLEPDSKYDKEEQEEPQQPERPEQEPQDDDEQNDEEVRSLRESNQVLKQTVETLKADLTAADGFAEAREAYRKDIAERHEAKAIENEIKVERSVTSFFEEQLKRVLEGLNGELKGIKANSGNIFDDSAENEALVVKMRATFEKMARNAWREANARVGVDLPAPKEEIQRIVDDLLYKFSDEVTKNTSKDLNAIFTKAIAEGFGVDEIARQIKDLYAEYTTSRARMIARTETNKFVSAITFENYQEAKRNGIFDRKEWLAVGDHKTREAHGIANGQVVDVDRPFIVDGESMMYPSDPNASAANVVNCRCTLIPVLI